MFYILIICAVIILTVILIKKYVLKVDYSEYSKDSNRLNEIIKTEKLPDEENEK